MRKLYFTPRAALFLCACAALTALLVAWGMEFILGFAPCRLCIWQRWPYVLVILLAGLHLLPARPVLPAQAGLPAASLLFAAGALIAFWHMGIEQGRFPPLANCAAAGFDLSRFDPASLPAASRCDEAPFRLLGLSLAFYNGLSASLLAGFALWAARQTRQTRQTR